MIDAAPLETIVDEDEEGDSDIVFVRFRKAKGIAFVAYLSIYLSVRACVRTFTVLQ